MHRVYTFGERIADGAIHAIGVTGGLIAAIVLLAMAYPELPVPVSASLSVYALAMVAMFGFSAAYNLIDVPAWTDRLRRFDQAAIFAKIAGTYTPLAFVKIGGFTGYGLLIGVWSVALFGIVSKLSSSRRWERTTIVLYLALGWVGVLAIFAMLETIEPASLILLFVGGILYSVGVIFHLWSKLPYQNAIWHLFVLVATASHFLAIVWAVFE